ncbi:acyltransferase family protein [Arthrobacter glacialis]|uniref:acyltransferase family protein n=1 Tax=Arthrobacter glacialis TaxID=1664 RepID=UPI000CD428A9|nr:acyltransferase family protein [Arthrobacter glacialis]POH59951.1 acyltransferase [Arthrobacter glacialis]
MTQGTIQKLGAKGRRAASKRAPMSETTGRKFLPEVQGLRALAVLMVVAYHVWFGRISGGVDIFLLVSAFLLTGQFTRKLESGNALELLKYWVHLFKRLLPMIAVTLLATLGATYLFLPESRWSSIFGQTWASLFYYQNWFLASEAVDYYAADHSVASPLQHFWSLSIQGQIFILWPLIFAGAAILARVFRLRVRVLLLYMFGAVFASSLIFSIITTNTNQTFAYFDTRARLWEFALGSLLALVLPYLQFSRGTRVVLGWLGVVAMLACGLVLQVGQQFPGYMALWPTLAAACIIVAGFTNSKFGADRFLSMKPLVKLGDSSYALYLFHWPILVVFLVASGRDQAGPKAGLAIIVASILAAWAMTKWVDTPLRRNKWIEQKRRRALTVIVVCVSIVALPLTAWQVHVTNVNNSLLAGSSKNNPGAASLWSGYVDQSEPGSPLLPTFTAVAGDWPTFSGSCESDAEELINRCTNEVTNGSKSVFVIGSSHAHVLNTPILAMAEKNNWSVTSITKGYCPLGTDTTAGISDSCVDFNKETMAEVLAAKPDLVVTTSTRTDTAVGVAERLDPTWVDEVSALNAAGIKVVALRDTPRFAQSVPACLEQNPNDFTACDAPRAELYQPASPTDAVAGSLPNTTFLDLTENFCNSTMCPAVIGNVIVYKDDNHVTATYMKTLDPVFDRDFRAATGWSMN